MWSLVLGVCLALAACGPVLLVGDDPDTLDALDGTTATEMGSNQDRDAGPDDAKTTDTQSDGVNSGAGAAPASEGADAVGPEVRLSVRSIDCGSCFELVASGEGGVPPYSYEWDDGSREAERRVCSDAAGTLIWVIVQDSASSRSNAHVTWLEAEENASSCADGAGAQSQPLMCLMNPSFEGTPAINTGTNFDAAPWSQCTDPAQTTATPNTPVIANETLDPQLGLAPMPQEGNTYLSLGMEEQASQTLCEPLSPGSERYLELDLTRIEVPDVTDPNIAVYLEVWGGLSVDCSQRQLLWASPSLTGTWSHHCFKLQPSEYTDQITLRAKVDAQGFTPEYMAVDNLVPVTSCASAP